MKMILELWDSAPLSEKVLILVGPVVFSALFLGLALVLPD